jgi:hypothetical protein
MKLHSIVYDPSHSQNCSPRKIVTEFIELNIYLQHDDVEGSIDSVTEMNFTST